MTKNMAVIGGGIIGLTCAFRLQAGGHRVTLIDEDAARPAASWGNAGHIAVEQTEPLASLAYLRSAPSRLHLLGGALDFRWRDARHWAPFVRHYLPAAATGRFEAGRDVLGRWLTEALPAWRRLLAALGEEALLAQDGHYVVWETERAARKGRRAWSRGEHILREFTDIAASEKRHLEELLHRPLADAVRFRQSGQIRDLWRLQAALRERFLEAGGSLETQRALCIRSEPGGIGLRLDDGEARTEDAVVIAAGIGSRPILESFGYDIPLIAERGYHIEGGPGGWPADLPPVVIEDRGLIVTRFEKHLRLASFVEFAGPDAPPDPRKWKALRRHASALGIALEEPVRQWMGARPTLPDYLPAIGRSARDDRVFYAFGHQHLGLTLAAVTGEVVAALAAGEAPSLDIAPLRAERFSQEKRRIA
ncbi:NAD(P)/FAD-dependent oxidoreductase [Parvularcula oceani]|uniref:NAD(P)/FAD-dependent oxidoreductase n=1 Tax=Parvularcula oceani TaxID=1247963 RepID=UPI0004E10B34|nr:FAD-binding oxidoreductase [Parvularcula oceani]